MTIEIYNEDCFETMNRMDTHSVDVILTSPFYNTNKKAGKTRTLENTFVKGGKYNYVRYDVHVDNMTNDEYCAYTVNLFDKFDKILQNGGVRFVQHFIRCGEHRRHVPRSQLDYLRYAVYNCRRNRMEEKELFS